MEVMEEPMASRYWCHFCSQMVHPVMEIELKCPLCQSGFVEEMSSVTGEVQEPELDFSTERGLPLWAPILLGMMGSSRRRRRLRRTESEEEEEDDDNDDGESELEREFESFMRRSSRRSSATILQLLQGIRAGIAAQNENSEGDMAEDGARGGDREGERGRQPVILINPTNRTVVVQGSRGGALDENHIPIGSLGDYFVGPGLDLLLQHLAENDPNRYGTPPAQKEAIEALPTVKINDTLQCSVCLDDFEIGTEAKEMPCKHRFHSGCILKWLELHSSCPVCRFQLPSGDSKTNTERYQNIARLESDHDSTNDQNYGRSDDVNMASSSTSSNERDDGSGAEGEGEGRNGNGRRFAFPWPFTGLFPASSSGSQSGSRSDET